MSQDTNIRLNKFISDSGFCSRREADQYIEEGRVTINGKDARKGATVKAGDRVAVDGEPIRSKKPSDRPIYIAFNKPKGITTTTDTNDKKNIIDFIGFPKRIFPIGRLDNASEGLIFLTNDGDIVNKILRAENNHEKEYIVHVDQPVTDDFVKKMSGGVRLFEGITKPCTVQQTGAKVFRIVLTQGLNRQIRRMCEALDYKVTKLKRVRIMTVKLADLPEGHWRHLTLEEIKSINALVAGSSKTEEASSPTSSKKGARKTVDEEYEALLSEEEFGVKVHQVRTPKPAPKAPTNPKAKTERRPKAGAPSGNKSGGAKATGTKSVSSDTRRASSSAGKRGSARPTTTTKPKRNTGGRGRGRS
ncbi:MAG: 23S rRNA pseudouridine(2604) synthase RluF [Rufibacter sp.]